MIPLDGEARDGAQQIGFLAMAGEMLDRLVDEQARLLPRALLAEQRDERRLAGIARPCRCGLPAAASSPLWSMRSSAIWKARPMLRA